MDLALFISECLELMSEYLGYSVQGSIPGDLRVTCTACAGTLLLEFGALSRMTGQPMYESLAKQAVEVVYGEHLCTCAPHSISHSCSQPRTSDPAITFTLLPHALASSTDRN